MVVPRMFSTPKLATFRTCPASVRTPPKLRFMHSLGRQYDLTAVIRVFDTAFGGTFVHRLSDLRLRPPHEALPVSEIFSARVKSAVDNVHFR